MTAAWMLCLLGTAALATLMAANGTWRRHPSVFVYVILVTAQSIFCWVLFSSHWYCVAYYGFGAASQLAQLWIMVELSTQVTAASPAAKKLLRRTIPTFALLTLLWSAYGAINLPSDSPRFIVIASHLDTAVSLSWAGTFILLVIVISGSGCQFSHGTRGIASGFLLEVLTSNVTAFLYVHAPNLPYMDTLKAASYGATILVWTVSLAFPQGVHFARLHYASPHALGLTAEPINGPLRKGIAGR